jgi:phosphopantothenoylcysteine decarboxylase
MSQPGVDAYGAQTSDLPFRASDHSNDGKRHLLLAASGSVATIKIPNILQALSHHSNLAIRLILTHSAANFLGGQSSEQPHLNSLLDIKNVESIYLDDDEWVRPWKRGDAILHIELRRCKLNFVLNRNSEV